MNTTSAKHTYAVVTLSGAMSKRSAYLTYINPRHKDGSTGAWRMEQTPSMKAILAEARAELELTNTIRTKRRLVAQHSLAQLTTLLTDTSQQTVKEQLDVLRMTKNILPTLNDILDMPTLEQPTPYKKPPAVDRSIVIQ